MALPPSVPPAVNLDWIQLGRLFALQTLLVASWMIGLPAESPPHLPLSLTHKQAYLHPPNSILLQPTQWNNNFPPAAVDIFFICITFWSPQCVTMSHIRHLCKKNMHYWRMCYIAFSISRRGINMTVMRFQRRNNWEWHWNSIPVSVLIHIPS